MDKDDKKKLEKNIKNKEELVADYHDTQGRSILPEGEDDENNSDLKQKLKTEKDKD